MCARCVDVCALYMVVSAYVCCVCACVVLPRCAFVFVFARVCVRLAWLFDVCGGVCEGMCACLHARALCLTTLRRALNIACWLKPLSATEYFFL